MEQQKEQQLQHSNGNQIRQRTSKQQHQKSYLAKHNDDDDAPEDQLSPEISTTATQDVNNVIQRKAKTECTRSTLPLKASSTSVSCRKMLLLFLLFLALLFTAIIPLLFRFSTLIQRGTVFMNIVNFSLRTPEAVDLRCTRNWLLHLKVPLGTSDQGKETTSVRLGVWHVSPQEASCPAQKISTEKSIPEVKLNDGRLVVLYSHGMGGTRSSAHRVALYRLLSNQLAAHVVAFDYRDFGDSGSSLQGPSADGLAEDTHAIYRWLVEVEQVSPERILLWGHSLGTAVAIRFLGRLSSSVELPLPLAAVLESPFTSLREAIPVFPLAKLFSLLPHFNSCFLEPLVGNPHLNFDSAALMAEVHVPLLFFHAEDDRIVPYSLGRKLYGIARQQQPSELQLRARFHAFPAERKYGHKNIVAAGEELIDVVRQFVEAARQQQQKHI